MGENDVSFLEELFTDFLQEANRVRSEIQAGIDAAIPELIARACHSLKGSAALLGALDLQHSSEELEQMAKENKLDDISLRFSVFEGHINAIRTRLDRELSIILRETAYTG